MGRGVSRVYALALAAALFIQTPLAAAATGVVADAAAATGTEPMVVAIRLNTQSKGDFFVNRTRDGDFLVKTADLLSMGLAAAPPATASIDGEPHVALRSIAGLAFSFDEKTLTIDINADPLLFPPNAVELGSRRHLRPIDTAGNSAFFNYSIDYLKASASTSGEISFAGEWGLRAGPYLALSNATTVRTSEGQARLVRLMSSVSRDDRETLRRYVIGDFYAGSRELGNGATIGGLGISKLYDLDPYLNRFPSQTISGVAALPSDLDVFVDGQKIRTEHVKPGPFELRDLAGYGGARSVQVVLRDPFGRVQDINFPLYFTDQPLSQGLHEYSYALGALRRDLGTSSNRYGPAAFAMYHRYGFNDSLTLGLRAEGTRTLFNGGPLATLVLGNAGVLNLALAHSSISGTSGSAALANYNYQSRHWNLSASLRRDSRRYAALGEPLTVTGRKYDGSASVGYNFRERGTLTLSRSALVGYPAEQTSTMSALHGFSVATVQDRRDTTVSYAVPVFTGRASLVASLSHVKELQQSRNELFVNLNIDLDRERRIVSTFQRFQDGELASVQLSRAQPLGEGVGYDLSASQAHSSEGISLRMATSLQYNAPALVVRGEYGRSSSDGSRLADPGATYRLSVAGGVVYAAGELALGRPVTDSFAIVRTTPLGGVPVTLNGQPMGVTSEKGTLLLPSLSSNRDNQVAILPENVPMEYAFGNLTKRLAPPSRSGVLLNFDVQKIQGISGKLKYERAGVQHPLEYAEIALRTNGKNIALPTGRGGEFYAENLPPGTHRATALIEGHPCEVDLKVPQTDEPLIDLGDVVCRASP
jgi:outer membrane usher protein